MDHFELPANCAPVYGRCKFAHTIIASIRVCCCVLGLQPSAHCANKNFRTRVVQRSGVHLRARAHTKNITGSTESAPQGKRTALTTTRRTCAAFIFDTLGPFALTVVLRAAFSHVGDGFGVLTRLVAITTNEQIINRSK